MEVEKRSSKGGFFHLFDWNAKSRKKLFSSKSELSGSNQGKENSDRTAISRLPQMKLLESGPSPSVRGSDYNCVSSVSSDEGCGTRAPGVVARLMGLDSLPTSDVSEPHHSPFFDHHSFRASHLQMTSADIQSEHHIVDYENVRNKLDGFSRNPVECRLQKVQNRPIERFQTEILPPKSARSISVTHHKLLSPIKSPGFILTKNATCIMEAASKIIEQSSKSTSKGQLSSFGSPSVPLRIRDLKEKLEAEQRASRLPEASQRSNENRHVVYMKTQPTERIRRGSEGSQLLKPSVIPEKGGSGSLKNKGKVPSLAIQAKTSVQRREGLASSGNRNSIKLGDNEAKSALVDKKQPNLQNNVQKRTPASRTSDVLKQNDQKQNCASSKERVSLKSHITSCQQDRKGMSTNNSSKVNKASNKVVENSSIGTRKTNVVVADTRKELPSSTSKTFRKKQPVNGDICFKGRFVNDVLINKSERPMKCNISVDECTNWDAVDGKNGMDIISFTFTSPIKKQLPGSHVSSRVMEKNSSLSLDPADDQSDSQVSYLSSLGLNVIDSDSLSVLLEQKLKELTCQVDSLDSNTGGEGYFPSSAVTLQESVPSLNVVKSAATKHDKTLLLELPRVGPGNQHDYGPSSLDELLLESKRKWQESKELEESSNSCFNNNIDYGTELDCHYPCPISTQPSFSGGSCNSSDSKTSFTSNGSRQCLSTEAADEMASCSARKPQLVEDEMEFLDSASSMPVGNMDDKNLATTSSNRNFEQSLHWELEYVKGVISNAELMVEDFVLGLTHKVMTLDLFDHLENQKPGSDKAMEEFFKLGRKLLFDCLNGCLEFRCEQISVGSYMAWVKWITLFQRKERLADELYKEICGWTSMNDLMVDEVVDKDMSTHHGKWIDFEAEAFEEGLTIENVILTYLVDEMVTDLLF